MQNNTFTITIWKYRNIIWKDRWYDYSYIIELLKFKLKDNIKNWDNAHYIGSDFTKKRMIVILKRIEEFDTFWGSYNGAIETWWKTFQKENFCLRKPTDGKLIFEWFNRTFEPLEVKEENSNN